MAIKFIILFNLIHIFSATIIVKPEQINKDNINVGIIFIQGASIEAKNYLEFFRVLQSNFSENLWIALTEFPFNTPEPLQINEIVYDALRMFNNNELNITKQTPIFFIGHSLGYET
jgi:hypothetical protein